MGGGFEKIPRVWYQALLSSSFRFSDPESSELSWPRASGAPTWDRLSISADLV